MTQRLVQALLAVVLAACAAMPAEAANKEHQQLMADIRMLQEQSQQLQILLGQLGDALKAVNTRLDEQTNATRKAFADQKLTTDALSNDLRIVREKVDDNNVRISSLAQDLEALRQGVSQMNAPRPTGGDPDPSSGAGAAAVPPPPQPGGSVSTSPTQLWELAFSDYATGQWDLAIQGFEAFLRQYPKSDKAASAQVNIGNAYENDNKYDKAIDAYDTAIRNYPSAGDAVAQAYYKKGLALRHLGRADQARDAFDACVKKDPNGDQGGVAILCKQALSGKQN